MSSDSNRSSGKSGGKTPGSWEHLRLAPKQPVGPEKPWNPDVEADADRFVGFLQDSEGKKMLQEFIVEAYKKFEAAKITQIQARMEHESKVQKRGGTEYYTPSNIGPMMAEHLGMHEVETSVSRGLTTTKKNLEHSVEERVDEINRLLANVGGFSAQLKSSFARSTVVFLEQEDPKYAYRERLIFSINLPNYELKKPWDKKQKRGEHLADGRTSLQATWDESVNALARIVETTGLKPKYCKNDRHYGRFVMKQDLRSSSNLPDEYFSFTLDYNTEEKIAEMCGPYDKIVKDYEKKITRIQARLKGWPENSTAPKYLALRDKYVALCQERDFFVGTTPDPHQLDEGLLFLIEVSTLKDYHVVKDRMQSIMTRYILFLSKIAAKEAEFDPEMMYQLNKSASPAEKAAFQKSRAQSGDASGSEQYQDLTAEELEELPQYTIDATMLKPKTVTQAPANAGGKASSRRKAA